MKVINGFRRNVTAVVSLICLALAGTVLAGGYESHKKMGIPEDVDPIHETYLPVMVEQDFETMMKKDVEAKQKIMERQKQLLERRYDLSDQPSTIMMSGAGRPCREVCG